MKKKKKKKTVLNPYERTIIDVLRNARRPLSTSEVAEYSGMSWMTAKNYLERLYRRRKDIHTRKKGKSKIWYIK